MQLIKLFAFFLGDANHIGFFGLYDKIIVIIIIIKIINQWALTFINLSSNSAPFFTLGSGSAAS